MRAGGRRLRLEIGQTNRIFKASPMVYSYRNHVGINRHSGDTIPG